MTDSAHKTVRSAPGVVVKSWEEDFAVAYAPAQAKTHMISAAGAAILEAASFAEVQMESLLSLYAMDELLTEPHAATPTQASQHLNNTVDGLVQAGLLIVSA